MNDENLKISQAEEEALNIMETPSSMTAEQWQRAKEDEACLQTCADIAETALHLMHERNTLSIDTEKELEKIHRRIHSQPEKRKKRYRLLLVAGTAVAASVVLFLLLRPLKIDTAEGSAPITVFRADPLAARQPLLEIVDEEAEQASHPHRARTTAAAGRQKHVSETELNYADGRHASSSGNVKMQIHRLSIPRGETFRVILSDGTEVFLNTDSRLTYPAVFKGSERVVTLDGEAYFKVAKDARHPFVVKSGSLQIRVLGTEFDVCHYASTAPRVTLISGKVAVSDTCGLQTAEMTPGQSLQVSEDGTFAVNEADIEAYTYWKEGYFYFDNVTLSEMMREIGRWYNIDVEFRNTRIASLRIHFFADRRQSLTGLLEHVNRMEAFHVRLETGRLIVE